MQGSGFSSLGAPGVGTEGGCRALPVKVSRPLSPRLNLGKGFQDSRPLVSLTGCGLPR